jgi:ectoine hydroxylase-related dioxygenase (phytanoyl-CoA dioxygenase family)
MVYSLLVATTSLYFTEYFLKVQVQYYKVNKVQKDKCTRITTDRIQDLLVARDQNVSETIDIVNKHGLVFIQDLLSQEQVKALRQYIMQENLNANREKYNVIETKHRHHITFALDEHPIITHSVHSILTSQPLRGVMEEMLGPDAALVELAAITSYPGAQAQRWHKDASEGDRDVALYSLFIPLQETTREMGATAFAAGTHTCEGYEDEWNQTIYATAKVGTGALLSCRIEHQGGANTASNDLPARAMFYLSFTQARNRRDKDHILPSGTSYAIRADQLGRSLSQIINHSYNALSPIDFWSEDRGWNYFEMACSRLADKAKIQYFRWDAEDFQKAAANSQSIAICLLILYMFVAEIDNFMNRRKMNRFKQENHVADEVSSSKIKKKKKIR